MMNLAVVAGSTAVAAERKLANFAVERCRLLFLFAYDGLIAFALKVQYQPLASFVCCKRGNVHVEVGRYV